MQDYLLDANHITALYNKDESIVKAIRKNPVERKLLISQFTRGELEAGQKMYAMVDEAKLEDFWKFVDERFCPLEITENRSIDTSVFYGDIIGRLNQKYPKTVGKKTEVWLVEIGVQITDVWLVAESLSHNVVFVTNDKMDKIKEVVGDNFRIENWL